MGEKEIAIIPKGSYVGIMGCRFTLMEDTKVEANQANLDYILKDQKEWYNKPKTSGCANHPKSKDTHITIHSPTGSVTIKRSKDAL